MTSVTNKNSDPLDLGGPIGFVGVGAIAHAMVTGLCRGPEPAPQVLLSPRGAATSAQLAAQFATTRVCASNQEVADKSAVLVLAARPADAPEVLQGLRIREETVVVSVMAGVGHDQLRALLPREVTVVRSIPMPAVSDRSSITATYPTHPVSTALFDRLGETLPVGDEAAFAALSAVTGTLSSFLEYLSRVAAWAVRQGITERQAEQYVRGLFANLAPALEDHERSLAQLVRDHETPDGINEQLRQTWLDQSNTSALDEGLDGLRRRLS